MGKICAIPDKIARRKQAVCGRLAFVPNRHSFVNQFLDQLFQAPRAFPRLFGMTLALNSG